MHHLSGRAARLEFKLCKYEAKGGGEYQALQFSAAVALATGRED